MDINIAQSAAAIPQSRIREIANIAFGMAAEKKEVLPLYFGESNQPTPQFIKDAAAKALADGFTFYTSNAGLLSLREALRDYYARLHSVSLDPAREIVVTASGVQALNVAIRCMLDPGDEALILTPAWPNGPAIVTMANARAVMIPQPLVHGRFEIDWEVLEASVTPRTRMLLYTSPSNPLGWVATEQDQERLLEFTRRHRLWLLADEVYERLWYETPELGTPVPSILRKATREDAVVVAQSFSKAYCMTGWRLGWMVARADLAERASQLNEFIISCANGVTQKAAETALRDGEPEVHRLLAQLKSNRDFCLDAFNKMPGVTVPRPEGAFYLFPRIAGLTDSFDFCRRLLLETHVGIAPGIAFGPGGEGSVRVCYAADQTNVLKPAMERIAYFLQC